MNPIITEKSADIAELCRRHGVRQLEAFDPVGKGLSSPSERIDVGFLVEFEQDKQGFDLLNRLTNLEEDLQQILQCRVDLTQRCAIETSPNYHRRKAIFNDLEAVYG